MIDLAAAGQNIVTAINNLAITFQGLSRRKALTEDTTFYVRTGGSDTTGDGTVNDDAHAFATPQGAYEYLLAHIDAAGFLVKIKMAAGTYTASPHRRRTTETSTETTVVTINQNIPGAAAVVFEGDQTTPTNVVWTGAGNILIWAASDGIYRFEGIYFNLMSRVLFCNACGANISFDDVNFGSATSSHMHLYGPNILKIFGDYTISGGATRHIWLEGGGAAADLEDHTVTITGTPAFTTAFVVVDKTCNMFSLNQTFSGSATGVRYQIVDLGVISTASGGTADLDSYFPGDTQGIVLHRLADNHEISVLKSDGSGGIAEPAVQLLGRDSATTSMVMGRWSDDAFGPEIVLLKSRSSTVGGTLRPDNGDEIGRYMFHNRDTTNTAVAAGIRAICAGTAASNDAPTNMEFGTTPDGSGGTDTTWRWRITLNGHLHPLVTTTYTIGTSSLGALGLYLGGVAFASVPTAAAGAMAYITDSNTTVWGATISASSSSPNKVLAWNNGTNWTVVGV